VGACDPAGQGYLLAGLARKRIKEGRGRLWIMTPHARRRDELAEEFAFWKSPSLVLSDPTVMVDQELADPDREAERIATLHRIARSRPYR
jgi:hypothetical protein